MQATLIFYIVVGVLTVVPLLLFNINRVFVRKKPDPLKINWVRGVVILLLCAFIVFFLCSAYNATLHERYEIALERVATAHAELMLDKQTEDGFKQFLMDNGTENMKTRLETLSFGTKATGNEVRFQLSMQCVPKYWEGVEGFEQVAVIDAENPVYLMYLLEYDGAQEYYAVRLVNTEEQGWLFDWIGEASEQQQKVIKMPTQKNGKWYSVTR